MSFSWLRAGFFRPASLAPECFRKPEKSHRRSPQWIFKWNCKMNENRNTVALSGNPHCPMKPLVLMSSWTCMVGRVGTEVHEAF